MNNAAAVLTRKSRSNSNSNNEMLFENVSARTIAKIGDVGQNFKIMYSRMKHGDPRAVRSAAILLADKIIQNPIIKEAIYYHETIVITSSAFGFVPTASYAVMKDIALLLKERGVNIEEIKIDRAGDFGTTAYGSMSTEEREERIRLRRISLDEEARKILEERVCLVIDDVKVTGSHEKTLKDLLFKTEARTLIFCYLLNFTEELAMTEPQTEELFNYAAINSILDLKPFFKVPKSQNMELRVNARTIKYILSTDDSFEGDKIRRLECLKSFLENLDNSILTKLYEAAVSSDRYFQNPKFIEGFHVLSDIVVAKRVFGIAKVCRDANATVFCPVTIDDDGNLLDMETGEDVNHVGQKYSLMKHGSYADIVWFGEMMANKFIDRLRDGKDNLLEVFQKIKAENGHIAMLSPGSRNVESSQNFIYEVAVKRINVWLALNGLPTIILTKLSRFSSGIANYAQLSAGERMKEKRNKSATKSVLPSEEFFQVGVHVVFADDARITGASADRVEVTSLSRGALSFFSMYCLVVDPLIAVKNPAVEHFLNTLSIKGCLDENVVYILNQKEFRPVQRMLRLVLNRDNYFQLKKFLKDNICTGSLVKLYESALGNGYLDDDRYASSIAILQDVLKERGLIGDDNFWS